MATPSTTNLLVQKGNLYFDRWDASDLPTGMRHLGNAPAFTLALTLDSLDHESSMEGLGVVDLSIPKTAKLTAKFTLEEWDEDNLALAFYGDDPAAHVVNILSVNTIRGHLRFIGNPPQGPMFRVELWKVLIKPTGDTPFIGTDWASMQFECTVERDADSHPTQPYGTIERFWDS